MESRTGKLRLSQKRNAKPDPKGITHRYKDDINDSNIRKGADIVRRQVKGSFFGSKVDLTRSKGSDISPTSICDISAVHADQVYEDLNATEKSWATWTKRDSTESKSSSRMARGIELSPQQSDKWRASSSSNKVIEKNNSQRFFELSAVDASGAVEGLEVVDTGYFSSRGPLTPEMSANNKQFARKNRSSSNSDSRRGDGTSKSRLSYSNGMSNYNDDNSFQERQSQDFSFPCQDNWDSESFEINEIQNNLYLLKAGDNNNDNTPARASSTRNREYDQNDDIFTITEDSSQANQLSTGPRKNSQSSLRSSRNRSLLEAEHELQSPQNQVNKQQQSKGFSFRSLRPMSANPKSSYGSTRSDGYFTSSTTSTDVDLGAVPSPLTVEYTMLLQDPAYRHAQKAGFLWQSIMGQHIRFPSSWWCGARAPPMGVGNIESCKWAYYGRHTVKDHFVLNQLHTGRGSPGKLLLHILVQDLLTRQTVQDIAIGCFHPNARGVRKSVRASSSLEDSRDLWLAVRKRNKTSVSAVDKVLSRYSQWGESGYTKSPLGPEIRISNHNVRAVFGETPPLETIFLSESELYERLSGRIAANKKNVVLPLLMLKEFVFAEER